jgi:hypothetical protein
MKYKFRGEFFSPIYSLFIDNQEQEFSPLLPVLDLIKDGDLIGGFTNA